VRESASDCTLASGEGLGSGGETSHPICFASPVSSSVEHPVYLQQVAKYSLRNEIKEHESGWTCSMNQNDWVHGLSPSSGILGNTGRWRTSKNPVILVVIHQRQNPVESACSLKLRNYKCISIFSCKFCSGSKNLGDIGVDARIGLKWFLCKIRGCELDPSASVYGSM
jgi:hypothetical protein